MPTGSEIRRTFLEFFEKKGHRIIHSSSLVPANDPTLLFTNAGMNQFKDVFLGLEKRDYNRATTSQKCVRAGGKHNDLENVGFTNRHHTFFEMLGNFSFGDYFKKDAIAYAWELITSREWFNIPKERLYVTIFGGGEVGGGTVLRDDVESEIFWSDWIEKNRIKPMGAKDNFWAMGDTGPCGPCSEIHYDMGAAASDQGHTDCEFGCDCGRYVEIWNLVFMQFDRDATGTLSPLPKPSIDTGAGLERMAAVMLNLEDPTKISNYETDLFTPLIERAAELCSVEVPQPVLFENKTRETIEADQEIYRKHHLLKNPSLRVIADHSRAATFLISDGVFPSNEGRGYVLRKIIRRGIRHGRSLGQEKPFMRDMVFEVRNTMRDAYPELMESAERVAKVIEAEEHQFARTVSEGLRRFDLAVAELIRPLVGKYASQLQSLTTIRPGLAIGTEGGTFKELLGILQSSQPAVANQLFIKHLRGLLKSSFPRTEFPGKTAFDVFQTFGLPLDFMTDAARDIGIEFDSQGFDAALAEEQTRARASWKGAVKQTANPAYQQLPKSTFEGYRHTRSENCEVLAIIKAGQGAQELHPGDKGEIILDHTPFYAESGGQVGDRGVLYSNDHNTVVAEVAGTYAPIQGVRAHQIIAKQPIRVGDKLDAVVNAETRAATMRNHTATHLLQAGLREVLGKHVKQAGSLVAPNHLRFDFSHFTGVAEEELQDIEDIINKEVLVNEKIEVIENVPIDVAVNEYHAMALFGEKYGDRVRVIKIGDFSTELCGGTHTSQTGEIGLIKILKEGSVSSGVRRIEAVTGEGSLRHFRKDHQLEGVVASLTSKEADSPAEALRTEIDRRDAEIKRLTRELDQVRMKSASSSAANLGDKIKEVRGVKVLAHRADNLERAQMRTLVDQLRDKLGSGIVVVGSATEGNVSLIAGVTKDLTSRVQAGKIVGKVAEKVGGKGGGRPDLAEAGGKDAAALDAALADVYNVVDSLLG